MFDLKAEIFDFNLSRNASSERKNLETQLYFLKGEIVKTTKEAIKYFELEYIARSSNCLSFADDYLVKFRACINDCIKLIIQYENTTHFISALNSISITEDQLTYMKEQVIQDHLTIK